MKDAECITSLETLVEQYEYLVQELSHEMCYYRSPKFYRFRPLIKKCHDLRREWVLLGSARILGSSNVRLFPGVKAIKEI